jgi:hypothetical protein
MDDTNVFSRGDKTVTLTHEFFARVSKYKRRFFKIRLSGCCDLGKLHRKFARARPRTGMSIPVSSSCRSSFPTYTMSAAADLSFSFDEKEVAGPPPPAAAAAVVIAPKPKAPRSRARSTLSTARKPDTVFMRAADAVAEQTSAFLQAVYQHERGFSKVLKAQEALVGVFAPNAATVRTFPADGKAFEAAVRAAVDERMDTATMRTTFLVGGIGGNGGVGTDAYYVFCFSKAEQGNVAEVHRKENLVLLNDKTAGKFMPKTKTSVDECRFTSADMLQPHTDPRDGRTYAFMAYDPRVILHRLAQRVAAHTKAGAAAAATDPTPAPVTAVAAPVAVPAAAPANPAGRAAYQNWYAAMRKAWTRVDAGDLLTSGTPAFDALMTRLSLWPLPSTIHTGLLRFPLDFHIDMKRVTELVNASPCTVWDTEPVVEVILAAHNAIGYLMHPLLRYLNAVNAPIDDKAVRDAHAEWLASPRGDYAARLVALEVRVFLPDMITTLATTAPWWRNHRARTLLTFATLVHKLGPIIHCALPDDCGELRCALTDEVLTPGTRVLVLQGVMRSREMPTDDMTRTLDAVCVVRQTATTLLVDMPAPDPMVIDVDDAAPPPAAAVLPQIVKPVRKRAPRRIVAVAPPPPPLLPPLPVPVESITVRLTGLDLALTKGPLYRAFMAGGPPNIQATQWCSDVLTLLRTHQPVVKPLCKIAYAAMRDVVTALVSPALAAPTPAEDAAEALALSVLLGIDAMDIDMPQEATETLSADATVAIAYIESKESEGPPRPRGGKFFNKNAAAVTRLDMVFVGADAAAQGVYVAAFQSLFVATR